MALHLERFDDEVQTLMRNSAGSENVEEAMELASRSFARSPALAAWLLEDTPGVRSLGSGDMVAVYTPANGWQALTHDLRSWWARLSEDTRAALLESSGHSIPAEHVREVTALGGGATRAAFVSSEGEENWMLTGSLRDFVESMQFRKD